MLLRHFELAFDIGIIFFITVLATLQKTENTVVSQESSHPKKSILRGKDEWKIYHDI